MWLLNLISLFTVYVFILIKEKFYQNNFPSKWDILKQNYRVLSAQINIKLNKNEHQTKKHILPQ